jgi:hypothetical protein
MRANIVNDLKLGSTAVVLALALGLVAPSRASAADASVTVHEATLQKFLSTLGSVGVQGGENAAVQYPYPGVCKGWLGLPYPCIKWGSCQAHYDYGVSISNMTARIVPGSVPFAGNGHAQASAGICGLNVSASYSPAINGNLAASWFGTEQEIRFAVQHLNVELYVSIIGFHVTLGWLDVASKLPNPIYRQKIELAKSFDLPAPISKTINASIQSPNVALMSGYLQFTTDIAFTATAPPGA